MDPEDVEVVRLDADEVQKWSGSVVQDSQNFCKMHTSSGEAGDNAALEMVADVVPQAPPVVQSSGSELQGTLITHSDSQVKNGTMTEATIAVHDSNELSMHGGSDIRGSQCIGFQDITYQVKQSRCCRRISNKVVLNSVSGELKPGLNAIMGPTGSGKTSLLDVLADRLHSPLLSGRILVNGKSKPSNFRSMVGYVVQDDMVMGTLSVRENLYFSAALRLPRNTTWKERKERVEKVIQELGLQSCAYTKVGNEFLRGVSGGERKRTNIGMELIIEPQILFLDEPTTGLDAYTAVSVVSLLKRLSEGKGRIVVMSIHQPRYLIFKLFDTLTLLSTGNVAYHGPSQNCLKYFEKLGFHCEDHENPADFLLDTLNRSERKHDAMDAVLCSAQDDVNFGDIYRCSEEYKKLQAASHSVLSYEQDVHNSHSCMPSYPTSFFWQFLMISARSGVNLFRNPGTSIIQYVTVTFFAFVIGGLFFQLGTEAVGHQDRVGLFFFVVTNLAFGSMPAIDLFIKERRLFIHEYASGYYGVLPFFLSKVSIDIVFFRLIPNFLFAIITYFMTGLQREASRFFINFLLIILINTAAVSMAFCISALTGVFTVANALISTLFVVSLLFGGTLVSLESLGDWVSWVRYLSFTKYGVEALAINELDGLTFICFESSSDDFDVDMGGNCTFGGLERLGELGFDVDWLWYDIIALTIFSVVFLIIAYIILSLIKKEK